MEPTTLAEITEELKVAREALDQCESEFRTARRNQTEAINRYNNVSKRFDKAVAELRGSAPNDTEWGRGRR